MVAAVTEAGLMPVEGRLSALTVAGAVEAIWSGMGSNPLLWGRRETPVCGEHGEELPDSGVILGCHPLFGQNASPSPYKRSARFRCSVAALMRLSCEACDSSPRCQPASCERAGQARRAPPS